MPYWRMQMHPNDGARATQHAVTSLAMGFIGLAFLKDPGDLRRIDPKDLGPGERDYADFALRMAAGDKVLVMAHHFPVAVATVEGDYNYVRTPVPELGVWFNHFRRVRDVAYYGDRVTNARDWQRIVMTDTLSPLVDPTSQSYRLIAEWA